MTTTIDAQAHDAARPADDTATGADLGSDALFAQVYDRLKAMASRQLASRSGATLQTTALVHELYLRVGHGRELAFGQPAQFFAYAARAMRHLLADHARARLRQRSGGGWVGITLDGDDDELAVASAEQALLLDDALAELGPTDPRAAQIVELRYFAGLPLEQVADTLGLSRASVVRDWRFARSFLHDRLE